jgi:molybdopterin-binding protein
MNSVLGKIFSVRTSGNLSMVDINMGQVHIQSIIIDNPESVKYLNEGSQVSVLFKETELILSVGDPSKISIENQFPCKVKELEQGKLLSRVVLDFNDQEIVAIVSTQALKKLELKPGSEVTGLVKSNEIMLSDD